MVQPTSKRIVTEANLTTGPARAILDDAISDIVDQVVVTDLGTTDGQATALATTDGTAFKAALSATIGEAAPPKSIGPRDLPRVKHGLRPTMMIDQTFPREDLYSHRILSTEGDTWWSFGHDNRLRMSTTEGRRWYGTHLEPNTSQLSKNGVWLKTAAGSILTTRDPYDGSPASLVRSTDAGVTWTQVIAGVANVQYLGPTSLCQSPTTGKIFMGEYISSDPSVTPTCRIKVSSDDGATWSTWKTLSRAYDTDPEVGVMHVHGIQIDPIDNRLWVCVGDAAESAGLYRMNVGETDWTAIATNRQLDTAAGIWGGAVGLMFFPDYIAWGVDQSFTSGLVRMARTEIGQPTPDVELVMKLNSTAFYGCRTDTTNEEWVVCASQEGTSARIDNAMHFYRVADNGATVDEIMAFPVNSDSSFSWAHPLGTPLQTRSDRLMWWGTNDYAGQSNAGDLQFIGFQFSARVGWSNQMQMRPSVAARHGQPATVSGGPITLPFSGTVGTAPAVGFASTVVPSRLRRLFILEAGCKSWTPFIGIPAIEVTDADGDLLLNEVGTPLTFATMSLRAASGDSAPFLDLTGPLTPGEEVHFRLKNNGVAEMSASAHVIFAWGI